MNEILFYIRVRRWYWLPMGPPRKGGASCHPHARVHIHHFFFFSPGGHGNCTSDHSPAFEEVRQKADFKLLQLECPWRWCSLLQRSINKILCSLLQRSIKPDTFRYALSGSHTPDERGISTLNISIILKFIVATKQQKISFYNDRCCSKSWINQYKIRMKLKVSPKRLETEQTCRCPKAS